ncbi:MAG: hypothetical protein AAGA56_14980 [Myxococcota bacterium]
MSTEQIAVEGEPSVPDERNTDPSFAPSVARLTTEARPRLAKMHRSQVHRDRWPDFEAFDTERYPFAVRRGAAVQWAGRARNEYGSVHQFSSLTHALTVARAPLHLLGALARLITDEVRHAELCAEMAVACDPAGPVREPRIFRFPVPRAPWGAPPLEIASGDGPPRALYRWAADVVFCACCIGETLSRPMLAAVETVATDPVVEAVAAQILRDEHLHAQFGWEALAWLTPRLDPEAKRWLEQEQFPRRFAGFERSTARGHRIEDIAGQTITIVPGDPSKPNLGTLTSEQYAAIYFATFEREILPKLRALGFEVDHAWAARLHLLT